MIIIIIIIVILILLIIINCYYYMMFNLHTTVMTISSCLLISTFLPLIHCFGIIIISIYQISG